MAIQRPAPGIIILIGFASVLAIILGIVFVSNQPSGTQKPAGGTEATESSVGLGHVHGLGIDPGDQTLFAATHYGVFKIIDGEPERIANRWQDTMGFAVVGPQHFLASGHPDLRENLPPHLGLIESRDGAETWQPVSLQGEADFHAIEPVGEAVVAFDATSSSLMVSADHQSWRTLDNRLIVDLASDPTDVGSVYATTQRGGLLRYNLASGTATNIPGPELHFIDWDERGLAGVTGSGDMFLRDGAADWQDLSSVRGRVQAFDADPAGWHAATDEGIFTSLDGGQTWQFVVGAAGHRGH